MDYEALAREFIDLRSASQSIRIERETAKMMKGELFVLMYLRKYNGVAYPKDLSKAMAATTARVAVVLNHLEAKKLITRQNDPNDSRQTIINITDSGQAEIEAALKKILSHVTRFFEALGEEDAKEYLRLQKKIAQIEDQML
ncbi:MAG: transcriptional regulator [Erysipelotrichaceae bacterium]|nr:transcriptional regulator [Erysipelotrichaceae bacterium]